jgi:hypothetical protein
VGELVAVRVGEKLGLSVGVGVSLAVDVDAARILLDEVRSRLVSDLAPARRILVGLPERDLLIAAGLADGDEDFAALFGHYVADRAQAADDPIDDRIFELVDGELVEFRAASRD